MKVKNKRCIRNLSFKQFKAAKLKNLIAISAIALTTLLFTSLFTIAFSINDGIEQSNFRQCGGFNHGTFKSLTKEQFNELKTDSLIKQWGLRRFVGMPDKEPFNKSHVEVGYSDATLAHWMYCDPTTGRLPKEGTNEAATDTRVLELLGIEPEIGTEFTMTLDVDGKETTQTFILCGYWEYDEGMLASHVLIPQSRAEEVYDEVGLIPGKADDQVTGSWELDVMFKNSMHIEKDMQKVLSNHGFQNEENNNSYISIGVNWGYSGSILANSLDVETVVTIIAILLLIIFTGYLIIYNVFQISVTNDIKFYGLLKTIGTTPRQLAHIVHQQALILSILGIPFGLFGGWLIGGALTPFIVANLNGISNIVSVRPIIFIVSALFSLLTVFISCGRPSKMAAKVSPIEAIRYTEGKNTKKGDKKSTKKVSPFSMARANLSRSRKKTILTVVSLALAVILLNLTVTFTKGFDLDKFLSSFTATDFIVAESSYFQTDNPAPGPEYGMPQTFIDEIVAKDESVKGGKIYGVSSGISSEGSSEVDEFVTEEYFLKENSEFISIEEAEKLLSRKQKNEDGLVPNEVQLYGMEAFALDQLKVIDGDLSKLDEDGGHYIAAVYESDEYGKTDLNSHWAKIGDTVNLHYVEKEYYYLDNGEIIPSLKDVTLGDRDWGVREVKYHDVEYTVVALVTIPLAISYRSYGCDEFVLNSQTFINDTETNKVMLYAFNTDEDTNSNMETFLSNYTTNVDPQYQYESKLKYMTEFEDFQSMFLLLGGVLSFIVGTVGILNFFNATLTSIITRRREFAMLQAVGMTGKQLKSMLVYEGLSYGFYAGIVSLIVTLIMDPLVGIKLENVVWFFTFRLKLIPSRS